MSASALANTGMFHGWQPLEDDWGDAMNQSLRFLDALTMCRVVDKDSGTPPVSPTLGDVYIVGPTPTGAWVGHTNHLARWSVDPYAVNAWDFIVPKSGWRLFVIDESRPYRYNGSAWLDADLLITNTQSGGTYTLALTDVGQFRLLSFTNATAISCTVPLEATVSLPVGSVIPVMQSAAGLVTFVPEGGVTLTAKAGHLLRTNGLDSRVLLIKTGTNTWKATGDLKSIGLVDIVSETGTALVLTQDHCLNGVVRQDNASPITTTVPLQATQAIAVGSVTTLRQLNFGQITVSPEAGVLLNIPTGYDSKTGRQGSDLMLHKVGTNEWDITGDLAPL